MEESCTIVLSQENGKIKAVINSSQGLARVGYYWDDNEEEAVYDEISDNSSKTEKLIEVKEGKHILTIKAVDVQGQETIKTQKILGDNKPEIDIRTNGTVFYITAKDDEGLTRIEYTFNSYDTKAKEINGTEFTDTIKVEDGENKLKVKVYNVNGLSEVKGVLFTKE